MILLVSDGDRDLWPGPTPEVRDSRTSRHSAHAQSRLTNLIGSGLDLLCLQSHSKPECRWTWPGVPIFPAHVKRDPWGRGCIFIN